MGQASSRHHHSPAVSSVDPGGNGIADTSTSAPSSDPTTTPTRTSRRTSLRKSFLNLVKPSSRNRADSAAGSKRKSWRSSKRWSKVSPVIDESSQSSQSQDAGPSTLHSAATEKESDVETEEVSEPIEQQIDVLDRPPTPFPPVTAQQSPGPPEGASSADRETSQNIGTWLNAQNAQQTLTSDVEDDVQFPPSSDEVDNPIAEDAPPPTQSAQTQSIPGPEPNDSAGSRHFPPPGTLVVVQGVVHTTDVPRSTPLTSNLEIPNSTSRSSSMPPSSTARNRLSALLRSRPTSMIATQSQLSEQSSASNTTTDLTTDPSPLSDLPQPESSTPSNNFSNTDAPAPPSEAQPSNENESRGGTISSSSIDVLGTLLSVAAAATAASLLTGSSEPILSSGLSPPYNANDPTSVQTQPPSSMDPWNSRPTSPTPTAGLGMGDTTAAGRAERLRHAWGSIRERLGLRPAPAMEGDAASNPDVPPTSASTDPRELMLAQMARAFNLGFGLAGEGASGRSQPERSSGTSANESNALPTEGGASAGTPQLPPQGSFERFLVDLQVDLREALTDPNGLGGDIRASHTAPAEPTPSSTQLESFLSRGSTPSPPPPSPPPRSVTPMLYDSFFHPTAHQDEDDIPPLMDTSDSEDGSEDDRPMYDLPGAFPSTEPSRARPQRQPHVEDADAPGTSRAADPNHGNMSNGSEPQTGSPGRINWWRLYRFPPITPPRPQGAAGVSTPGTSASGQTGSPPYSQTDTALPGDMDSTLAELPFANASDFAPPVPPQPVHTVIPVIVVGLQSVSASWPPHGAAEDDEGLDLFGEGADSDLGDDDTNDDGTSNPGNSRQGAEDGGRTRGRGPWHSRAAEAIRNLRHGRRNRTRPTTTLPGSRTFLIYVIGGYYPPNHSIVTGGPNSLDSFEALLELAELLGQVKPPTATKEEIEKSGLETIKAPLVELYEKEGKISSNCTERCLICLDDYLPEDNVRVMKCRHAFHQNCVDKWLETGRNNCPACRSKGVSLEA